MKTLQALLAAVALSCGVAFADLPLKNASGTDWADLWWNSAESGWGMQIVHQGSVLFATLYVYDSNGSPTFLIGAMNPSGGSQWSGDLYASTGPFYGGAFDPAKVSARKVGTINFQPTSSTTAMLDYSVDGVFVMKSIERELLSHENFSGEYVLLAHVTVSGCGGGGSGFAVLALTVTHDSSSMRTVTQDLAAGQVCTYTGTYSQAGRFGRMDASFTCTNGGNGQATFYEMTRNGSAMLNGLMSAKDNMNCSYSMHFTAISAD